MSKDMDFCHLREIYLTNAKKILDAATKIGIDAAKTAYKKLVHERAGAACEFTGNKIADKIVKPKPVSEANSRNAEEIDTSPEKRKILNELRQVLQNGTL